MAALCGSGRQPPTIGQAACGLSVEAQTDVSKPRSADARKIRERLLTFGRSRFRAFPWRFSSDPYRILVAEVLLHRTRAEQVVPLYEAFLAKFPSPDLLAQASLSEVHDVLQSAGLRWRVDALHAMGQELVSRFGGQVPHEREFLESLPGVSAYIASAVRCFAYGCPDVLLDTNTVRIVGRVFDVPVTDASRRSKRFRDLLSTLFDERHAREFNLALIDFGALVCRSHNPRCATCPIAEYCSFGRAFLTDKSQKP